MTERIIKYCSKNKDYAVDLLSQMIAIPTINPPGKNYEDMVSFLEKECRKLGLKTKKVITPEEVLEEYCINKGGSKRISVIAEWNQGGKKTLHINSHYDVVPVTDKWDTDPFKAVIKSGKVFGRGSEDMKGNIASVFFALRAIRATGLTPKINLQLSFTPDEEIGGRTGLGYLIKNGLVKADYAMSEGYSGRFVSAGNKGVLWGIVKVKGKAAHASLPHKGVNAFERMARLVSEFDVLKTRMQKRKTGFKMRDEATRYPTLVMGGFVKGGIKTNVVPGEAEFSIDRRLIPEEDTAFALKELNEIIKRFNRTSRDSKASLKITAKEEPAISVRDTRFFKRVSDSIKLVVGKKAEFCIMPGATDLRYFMWRNIPALGYSARGGESWHSDNEFVYIDGLVEAAKVHGLIMINLE